MRKPPFISVIVPTCFRNQLLTECVASILRQPYPSFEVIVVDQEEQSKLEAKLNQSFPGDDRIRYLHIERAGAARARNIGIARASGSIVAFIDDDAVAEPAWLEAIVSTLGDCPQNALIAGRILPIWTSRRPEWYPVEREFLIGLYDIGTERRLLPPGDFPFGANMAGRRDIVMDHGGFDENFGFNYFRKRTMITREETMLAQRIQRAGYKLLYAPEALVRHRISPYKLTRRYFLKRHFWEGVSEIKQIATLDRAEFASWPHVRYHAREICMATARFILPGFEARYPLPRPTIRMLALSRVAQACGVLYGIGLLERPEVESEPTCA